MSVALQRLRDARQREEPAAPVPPARPPLRAQQGPGGGVLFFTAGTVEEAAEAQPQLAPLDALLANLGTAGEDACGRTALHRAATEGDVDLIDALLAQADPEGVHELVEAGDRDGQTALHAAARCGQEAAVEALAAPPGRADVNAPDDAGWTPLHHAAASGSGTGALKALVRHGARLNAAAEGGWTPLHAAARHRNTAAVKALVEAGAQVDVLDEFGQTPLHAAAAAGCADVVEALLEARADPTLRAGRNDVAVGFRPLELVDALLAEQAESGRGPTVEARLCAALLRRAEAAHDAARLRLQLADASSRLDAEARAHEVAAQRAQRAERRVQELQGLEGREAALREAEEALDQARAELAGREGETSTLLRSLGRECEAAEARAAALQQGEADLEEREKKLQLWARAIVERERMLRKFARELQRVNRGWGCFRSKRVMALDVLDMEHWTLQQQPSGSASSPGGHAAAAGGRASVLLNSKWQEAASGSSPRSKFGS